MVKIALFFDVNFALSALFLCRLITMGFNGGVRCALVIGKMVINSDEQSSYRCMTGYCRNNMYTNRQQ